MAITAVGHPPTRDFRTFLGALAQDAMTKNANPFDKYLTPSEKTLDERLNFHLASPDGTFKDYVESKRLEITEQIASKHVIYLDTNAWKCISDFVRGKPTLTDEMLDFAQTATNEHVRANCVFPIGLSTLFELQAMNDPLTVSSLVEIVDRYSHNVCIQSHQDIITREVELFTSSTRPQIFKTSTFCRPVEVLGIPVLDFNRQVLPENEANAFRKAAYDVLISLPVSVHIEMARDLQMAPWDNYEGVDEMNTGKAAHQDRIRSYADALFVELTGLLKNFSPELQSEQLTKYQALSAMAHWKEFPHSRHLVTARILANLHAVMRYAKNRVFKSGDIADFATASVALPGCEALFTDRRLVNIVNDPHSQIKNFSTAKLVCGFDQFAQYLRRYA